MPRPRKKDPLQEQMLAFLPYLDAKSIANILIQSPDIDAFLPSTEQETQYPADPVEFMTQTLGYAMWPKLEEICRSVQEHKNTVVASGFGVGKCPEENESIFLADGSIVKAKNLVGKKFRILGFDSTNWQVRPMDAWAESNGLQEVVRVTLDSGQQVVRTVNHPLLTWEGWKHIQDLYIGSRVAIPLELPVSSEAKSVISDDEIKLLAYFIAEGGIKYHYVSFSQNNGVVLEEFLGLVDNLGCRVVQHSLNKATYSITGLLRLNEPHETGKQHKVNPAMEFCRRFRIFGKGSQDKFVPQEVFTLPDSKIALFLNRMFACDGWLSCNVDKRGKLRAEIGYSSASKQLSLDMQRLLLRLGIPTRIARKYEKKFKKESWAIYTLAASHIIRFIETVGLPLGKEFRAQAAYEAALDKPNSKRPNRIEHDLLPETAWKAFEHKRYEKDGLHSAPVRLKVRNGKHPSRRIVQRYESITGKELFNGWSKSRIGWATIKSIEFIGLRPTVAISVPETQAYVTDIIDHNSIQAAAMAMWWMTIHKPAIVITLAPSFSQVQGVIWRYMRAAGRKAELPGTIFDTPRWEVAPDHYAVGLSPRKSSAEDVTTIHGFHGPHVLVVLDEAAGLPGLIWDAVAGLVVGENCRLLAIGNPIEQGGPFWAACNSQSWHHIRISCFEHPNVVEGREVIPGAVTRGWIEERITDGWATEVEAGTPEAVELPWLQRWFLPTPIFMAKVQGIAPPQAEDQLIHLAWVVEAQNRVIEDRHAEVVLGLDPAPRSGDDNALCTRYGQSVRSIKRLKGQDTQVMAEWLAMTIRETGAIKAYIEDMGSGAGCTDKARAMGLPVIAVNTSRSARQKKRFSNLRAECWWTVRELLREGKMSLPANDHLLAGDLVAPKYEPDNFGRILIENKDAIRARLGRSPDSGDALAITYAQPVVEIDDAIMAGARELAQAESGGTNSRWVVEGRRRVSRWRR